MSTVIHLPGTPDDPDRDRYFQAIQLACAGGKTGTILCAQIDSLAATIAFCAATPAHAQEIIDSCRGDLIKAVADNWESVKQQAGEIHGEPGHG
jgi:hypothetical protein